MDATQVLTSQDESIAVVVSPWTRTGYHADGKSFDRPGRATTVLHRVGES